MPGSIAHGFASLTGVSRYKGADDPGALKDTAALLREKYPTLPWAKKSSVWAKG